MRTLNPFQMNDWGIKKFFRFIITLQLLLLVLVGLDYINIHIPIIRELIAFIYLTFIPGFLILKILKLHKLGNTKTVVYSIGLSITSVMFLGFLINLIYPVIGIPNPISLNSLIVSLGILIFILGIFAYLKDNKYDNPDFIELNTLFYPQFLFICLLPFLAILGTYLMNVYHNNILIFILIPLIGITVFLTSTGRFISKDLFPFTVFILSITILFHTLLISNNLWGGDIQSEYFFSSLVLKNSIWNYNLHDNYNALLSINMLAPIYSIILKMDLTWIFKIIYPFFLSIVPLTLFLIYKKQTNSTISFLACFLVISIYGYYNELGQMARQQIGELFLVLFFLVVLDNKLTKTKKSLLFILLGSSIVTSHYGITYIFAFYLIIFLMVYYLDNSKSLFSIKEYLKSFLSKYIYIKSNKEYSNHFNLLKRPGSFLFENIRINFFMNKDKGINFFMNKYGIITPTFVLFFLHP